MLVIKWFENLPQIGILTSASPVITFNAPPQNLFVRGLAFCEPWEQDADEPEIQIFPLNKQVDLWDKM